MAKLGVAALFTLPDDPRLRRVLVAYGLSRFTEFAGWLAILLVAYAQGGALLVGIAAFAMQLPAVVLVPLLAGYLDRLPRGRALTLTHACVAVCAGLTALVLLVDAPLWVVLVGGTATTVAVFSVRPSHFSTLPLLARGPGDLVAANGWSSFMDGAAIFVGFVVAGVLTHEFGAWVVLALSAVLGVVATALTSGLRTPVVGDGARGRAGGDPGGTRGCGHPAPQPRRAGAAAPDGLRGGPAGLQRATDGHVQR